MREIRQSGSEGGVAFGPSLPLSVGDARAKTKPVHAGEWRSTNSNRQFKPRKTLNTRKEKEW